MDTNNLITLLSSQSDILDYLCPFISYGSIFTLLDVSKFFRNAFEPRLASLGSSVNKTKLSLNERIVLDSIITDNVMLLRYFLRIGIKVSLRFLVYNSAKYGSINILKSNRRLPQIIRTQLLALGFSKKIVKHGQLELLKWAIDHKCFSNSTGSIIPYNMPGLAAENGHLHILEFGVQNGWICDVWTCARAAFGGHLYIVKLLVKKGCCLNTTVLRAAAEGGHLHIVKWLKKKGCPWNELACQYAAAGGFLEVLQFLRSNECPWNEKTLMAAASNGHLHVFQWSIENGCPCNEYVCEAAAKKGYLELLQWARISYFACHTIEECNTWDDNMCFHAAVGGQLKILQWAHESNCHWDPIKCLRMAKGYKHQEVVNWIKQL